MLLTPLKHNPAFPKWRTKLLLTTQPSTAAPNTKYAINNPTTQPSTTQATINNGN
jgi:hypothetical protein